MSQTDPLDQSQQTGRQQYALGQAIPILLFTLCTFGLISLLAWNTYSQVSQQATLFDAAVTVCDGQPLAEPSPITSPAGVAFRQLNGNRLSDPSVIPAGRQATTPAEISWVLCLSTERTTIRYLCPQDGHPSTLLAEYGQEISATLRLANSGEVVVQEWVTGLQNIPDCLPILPDTALPNDPVPAAVIQTWVETQLSKSPFTLE